ncbi:MAG TPA: 3D domain-containing protein [Terrimicrobiaceae bacterium]
MIQKPLLFMAALMMAAASVFGARDIHGQIGQRIEKVRTTAYTYGAAENGSHPRSNAIGKRLKAGSVSSAAADWSRWPLGTRFLVVETGQEHVVDDIGSAMVGTNTIDLFKSNPKAMNRWGVRHVTIEILEWGSPDESLEVLQNRKARYVRRIVSKLLAQKSI